MYTGEAIWRFYGAWFLHCMLQDETTCLGSEDCHQFWLARSEVTVKPHEVGRGSFVKGEEGT